MEDAGLGIKGAAALKNTSVQQPPFLYPGNHRGMGMPGDGSAGIRIRTKDIILLK